MQLLEDLNSILA